ncbi:MAG TPA: Sir2 family NAD-dependent protein deacetylase, partial [Pontiella sp.]|nr:Sir2 family NAD-dependent protein deacetylase [Pontiella sp.]
VNVFDLDAFIRTPSIFYSFARTFYPQVRDAQPNAAHCALVELQRRGKDVVVVTQNVDDYHQRAGSDPVYTVHGNHIHSTCLSCGDQIETEILYPLIEKGDIPRCACGGWYKPDITFFGEMLPEYDWNASVEAIGRCDLLMILGSSLTVYPAAGLPGYRPWNARMVIVNRDPTPLDVEAQLVINGDLCEVMQAVSYLSDSGGTGSVPS